MPFVVIQVVTFLLTFCALCAILDFAPLVGGAFWETNCLYKRRIERSAACRLKERRLNFLFLAPARDRCRSLIDVPVMRQVAALAQELQITKVVMGCVVVKVGRRTDNQDDLWIVSKAAIPFIAIHAVDIILTMPLAAEVPSSPFVIVYSALFALVTGASLHLFAQVWPVDGIVLSLHRHV